MCRSYEAKGALVGVMFDANRLIGEGKTKLAFEILDKKLTEIKKVEACDYMNVAW